MLSLGVTESAGCAVAGVSNVTGRSRSAALGRKPFHGTKYQKSDAPPLTLFFAASEAGSRNTASLPLVATIVFWGPKAGRSARQSVSMVPVTLLLPTLITHATLSLPAGFASRLLPSGSMRSSATGPGSATSSVSDSVYRSTTASLALSFIAT